MMMMIDEGRIEVGRLHEDADAFEGIVKSWWDAS